MCVRRASLLGVATFLLAVPLAASDLPTTIRTASELNERQQFSESIAMLERALPSARGDAVFLTVLRHAYRGEIQNLRAQGDRAAAERFIARLKLLEDAAATPETPQPINGSPAGRSDDVKVVMPETVAESAAESPGGGGWKRAKQPIARDSLIRVEPPASEPRTGQEMASEPASRAVTLRAARPVERVAKIALAEPDAAMQLISQADALFVMRRYADAANLYTKAGRANPQSLADATGRWAYCRLAAVVDRMNDQPDSFDEWSAIRAELDAILELVPSNEFAQSLLAAAKRQVERTGPVFAARNEPDAVIRANEPERAEPKPPNMLADLAVRIGLASANDASKRSARQRFRSGKWQVLETSNFRVHYTDENLGGQAADVAEATRIEVYRTWFRKLPESNWSPKCDIFIHDSTDEYTRVTRQGPGSPGHSQTGIDRGRVTSRRVDLRRDGADLVAAVLPHEITHVVLADRFSSKPLPRWADEGVAVLSEPAEKKQAHLRNLGDLSRQPQPRLFSARQLMTMTDYPPGSQWPMFYAESVSLVEFLAARSGPAKFIEFMEASQKSGYESALKSRYGLDGFAGLDGEWSRGRVEQLAAATTK